MFLPVRLGAGLLCAGVWARMAGVWLVGWHRCVEGRAFAIRGWFKCVGSRGFEICD